VLKFPALLSIKKDETLAKVTVKVATTIRPTLTLSSKGEGWVKAERGMER
jgi:hypothetical protein